MKIHLFLLSLGVILILTGLLSILLCPSLWLIGLGTAISGLLLILIARKPLKIHCHKKHLFHILTALGFLLVLLGALTLTITPIVFLGITHIAVGIILLELGLVLLIDDD